MSPDQQSRMLMAASICQADNVWAVVDIGEIPPHILASVAKASGDGDLHSNIHPAALASIASQSLPSWIWSHVPVLIDVSYRCGFAL